MDRTRLVESWIYWSVVVHVQGLVSQFEPQLSFTLKILTEEVLSFLAALHRVHGKAPLSVGSSDETGNQADSEQDLLLRHFLIPRVLSAFNQKFLLILNLAALV